MPLKLVLSILSMIGYASSIYMLCRREQVKVFVDCRDSNDTLISLQSRIGKLSIKNPEDITDLSIFGEHLNSVEDFVFQSFVNLNYLAIQNTHIENITEFTFSGLKNLKELHLISNRINSLRENVFSDLRNLTRILLSGNRIIHLPVRLFAETTKLESIVLDDNTLTTIPDKLLSKLLKLKEIGIAHNKLHVIKRQHFKDLINLKTLNMQNNYIAHIEKGAFQTLQNLENLNLNENFLKQVINYTFYNLFSLKSLSLSENNISIIDPYAFSSLSSLKLLDLNGNSLVKISINTFKNMHTLMHLYLSDNCLTIIEESSFNDLAQLYELEISHNELKLLDEKTFQGLFNLERLRMESNCIRNIHPRTFSNLSMLRFIDLSSNHLLSIDKGLFMKLYKLRSLYLHRNNLSNLHDSIFKELKDLRVIRLNENRIVELKERLFTNLSEIQSVEIYSNRISSIPRIFDQFDKMYLFNALDNNLTCSCYLLNTLSSIKSNEKKLNCLFYDKIVDASSLTCENFTQNWNMHEFEYNTNKKFAKKELKLLGRQFMLSFRYKRNRYNYSKRIQIRNNCHDENCRNVIININLKQTIEIVYKVGNHAKIITNETLHLDRLYMIIVKQEKINDILYGEIFLNDRVVSKVVIDSIEAYEKSYVFVENLKNDDTLVSELKIFTKDCSIRNGGCTDKCSYDEERDKVSCSCYFGELQSDHKTCSNKDILLFSTLKSVYEVRNKITKKYFSVKNGSIKDITYNFEARKLYFIKTDVHSVSEIWCFCLVTNSLQYLFTYPDLVISITFNSLDRTIIFLTSKGVVEQLEEKESVTQMYLQQRRFLQQKNISAIAFDNCNHLLFYSEQEEHRITSLSIKTGNAVVIADDLYSVKVLTLDIRKYKLYWSDTYHNIIEEANYDGSCRRVIEITNDGSITLLLAGYLNSTTKASFINTENSVISMTILDGTFYWSKNRTILKKNLEIGSPLEKVKTFDEFVTGLFLLSEITKSHSQTTCLNPRIEMKYKRDDSTLLYPFNEGDYITKLQYKHSHSEKIHLKREIMLFGEKVSYIYVSPQGFISTKPINDMNTNTASIMSVFASSTTNRFTGDVFVEETTNHASCEMFWKDLNSMNKGTGGSFYFPSHLLIVSWVNVSNIINTNQKNTFQAVMTTMKNETYVLLIYENIGVPFGKVGHIDNAGQSTCNKRYLNTLSSKHLRYTKSLYTMNADCRKNDRKLMTVLLTLVLFLIFVLIMGTYFACERCLICESLRRRVDERSAEDQ